MYHSEQKRNQKEAKIKNSQVSGKINLPLFKLLFPTIPQFVHVQ